MTRDLSRQSLRSLLFIAGDLLFLVLVGALATLTMHGAHATGWPFVVAMLVGMLAAMVVQTILAVAAAPLLGSIETMVPSMVIAMIAPMSVCTLHLLGWNPMVPACVLIGSGFGAGMFVYVRAYGSACAAMEMQPTQADRDGHGNSLELSSKAL